VVELISLINVVNVTVKVFLKEIVTVMDIN